MTSSQDADVLFSFGPFVADPRARLLLRDGRKIPLRSRSFDILCILAGAKGNLVTKDDLMSRVWRGAIVEDNALQVHVSALRKALGEGVGTQRHVVTVPGQGYRFVKSPLWQENAIKAPSSDAPTPSIAVMPFQNLSGDSDQDYFADGVVEGIITELAHVPSLCVVARNSSFAYKGRTIDIRQVGSELGVRYILEGSVRKSGARLRLSGQLIQADTGLHLWAGHFDGDLADVFTLQDEITSRVVGALLPSLQTAEIARARKKPPDSVDAYDLYLRALACRNALTPEGGDEALRLLDRALTLDPTFVSAAMLASIMWALRHAEGWSPKEDARAEAVRYARLAVRLDPHNAEALAILARWLAQSERGHDEARSLAARAIAMGSNAARVWRGAGYVFVYIGEPERALEYLQRGLHFNPRDSWVHDSWSGVALALIQLERDREALVAARHALQLEPRFTTALRACAAALGLLNQRQEAHRVMSELLALDPTCSLTAMKERWGYSKQASLRYFEGLRRAGLPE